MRITQPRITRQHQSDHSLIFDGERGERLSITVLDHDLIRVCHWPDGKPRLDRTWMVVGADGDTPREGRQRDDLSPFPLPPYQIYAPPEEGLKPAPTELRLTTDQLQISISLPDFRIEWADVNGNSFAADLRRRAYEYDRAGKRVFHYLERRANEHYYGFGERAGALDKTGYRMRMLNLDSLGYNAETGDPLYKHFPFYITYVPELNIAYGLFYDNLAPTTFDMGKEISAFYGFYRYYQADDGDLDCYMIYGPTIAEVVAKFTRLTGRIHLPPRWSLGYLGSTMVYTEAADAGEQLKKFVDLCREHDIPCDLFHLSSGYTSGADSKRYVFSWNRDKVPDPAALAAYFKDAGIHLSANIKPWMLMTHPHYDETAAAGGFIQSAEANTAQVDTFWSGAPFTAADGSYFDFTSDAGFNAWKNGLTNSLLKYGIESAWNDNNEFEIWDDEARCDGFGAEIPVSLARPLQTLLMARASFEAQESHQPDERPFVLSRSACPGVGRYAQTWSGDNFTSWHTLKWNIPMGLGLSLSGMANTGHDVGGFYGLKPEPELFIRWIQNGIFHPRFTIHSYNTDGTVNEPWMYLELLPLVRELFQFRYRLIPYLYSLLWQAAQSGAPVIRPLVYAYPDDPRTHCESFDFLLGPNLLVASVLEEGARVREVYLPGKGDWYNFYTGAVYTGGQTITVDAPLERIPLFVPAGGLIPMGKPMKHVGAEADDVRQVYVFPGRGSFTLIEDDGHTLDYRRGVYTEVELSVESGGDEIHLSARHKHAGFPLPYSQVEFILPTGERRMVGVE